MKTIFFFSLFILANLPLLAFAQEGQKYQPLVKIPGITDGGGASFSNYINFLYALSISVAALIAVIKIIIAGAKYMLTDIVTSKGEAIKDIKGALLGLLLILGAFLILETINPRLTKNSIEFSEIPADPPNKDRSSVAPPGQGGGNSNGSAGAGSNAGSERITGGCGTKTDQSTSQYTITVMDVSGCTAGSEGPHLQQFALSCSGTDSSYTYNNSTKNAACAKPKTLAEQTGIQTQGKVIQTKNMQTTQITADLAGNQIFEERRACNNKKGIFSQSSDRKSVTCKWPTIISYSGAAATGSRDDCKKNGGEFDGNITEANYCIIWK